MGINAFHRDAVRRKSDISVGTMRASLLIPTVRRRYRPRTYTTKHGTEATMRTQNIRELARS